MSDFPATEILIGAALAIVIDRVCTIREARQYRLWNEELDRREQT